MVHALRRLHRALAPGGVLVDLRPTTGVELASAEGPLGSIDDAGMLPGYRAADEGLSTLVAEGLLGERAGAGARYVERYDTYAHMAEHVLDRDRMRASPELIARAATAPLPLELRHGVALRLFNWRSRPLPPSG